MADFTYEQLHNAFDLTLSNAKQLKEEADTLYVFEHYAMAYTLYQLAIEEVGKCIKDLSCLYDDLDWEQKNLKVTNDLKNNSL